MVIRFPKRAYFSLPVSNAFWKHQYKIPDALTNMLRYPSRQEWLDFCFLKLLFHVILPLVYLCSALPCAVPAEWPLFPRWAVALAHHLACFGDGSHSGDHPSLLGCCGAARFLQQLLLPHLLLHLQYLSPEKSMASTKVPLVFFD